ncbi:anti-sigma factor RsbA family regulatory protein [Actinokineospora sp.]|uniref:anti-sigma factor RsbA family regulatory protein n=1 Tax=Actinokineospora sp. TaxID=1872133 RepID=UPI003D6B9FA7
MTASEGFAHPALFYRGADEYLDGTLPFIRAARAAGEPVAVAVPGPNLKLLRDALGADADEVRMLDMTEAGRNPGRIIATVLRAFADSHPDRPVRIIGEPIWADRSDLEYPACAQHEALINLAFTGRDATILCPYDTEQLAPWVIADAEATHPVLIDAGGTRASTRYAPLDIVDRYNQPLPEFDQPVEILVEGPDLTGARILTREHAGRAGVRAERVPDVELVVTELATNSLLHGGGTARIRLGASGRHFVCEVRDTGRLTDPLAGRHPSLPGQSGGRGLLLVHHVSDLVRTRTEVSATTIQAYFRVGA